jgi:hypothetical protein
MPWLYLTVLVAGAAVSAGFVGRAVLRHPDARRLDRYAGREQPVATFLRGWTRPSNQAPAASAASPPSPVPYMRAPNLAWLADEPLRHPDQLRWPEAPEDVHAEPRPKQDFRRARTG